MEKTIKFKNSFQSYRFDDLCPRRHSNKYLELDRINEDETKIVVNVGESHLIPTLYGYALILDRTHVVFLKEWQVNINWFGCEVMLMKKFFLVKEWGEHEDFIEEITNLNWDTWLNAAKVQCDEDEYGCKSNPCYWKVNY